jgi:hypothetical protein
MHRYFARGGRVYVKPTGEPEREVSTAITSSGRDLERFERALDTARSQRADRNARLNAMHTGTYEAGE